VCPVTDSLLSDPRKHKPVGKSPWNLVVPLPILAAILIGFWWALEVNPELASG